MRCKNFVRYCPFYRQLTDQNSVRIQQDNSQIYTIQIAEYVLRHREFLSARQAELTAQFEQVSQALLSLFAERWKRDLAARYRRSPGYTPGVLEFERELQDTYRELMLDQTGTVRQWYEAISSADRFSHYQGEVLFWHYFNRHHRERLLEESLPTTFVEESEE